MVFLDQHYSWNGIEKELALVLTDLIPGALSSPYVLCVGTDRHILDCLGPLTGAMVIEQTQGLPLYGTLYDPLHAHNLSTRLHNIRSTHEHGIELVIDASMGEPEEVGRIRLRSGSIYPGKASGKTLPALGVFALTGVVKSKKKAGLTYENTGRESLAVVYSIARILSTGLVDWYKNITSDI